MNKKQQTTLITILIVLAGLGAIYFFAKPSLVSQPSSDNSKPESASVKTSENISEDLIYAIRADSYTDIYLANSKNTNQKKVYTDRDEDLKIKSLTSLTYDNRVLAAMAPKEEEFINSLYLIHTDGSGQKDKLADNFASTSAPIISPDGQKIAYTLFSNAEADFGFKLIVANYDNSNKRELLTDSTGINLYSWDPDSQNISFSKGSVASQTEIKSVNLDSLSQENIFQADGIVQHFSWVKDDLYIYSSIPENKDYNQGEIYTYLNKKINRLTNNTTFDDFAKISPRSQVSYLSYNYEKNIPIIYQVGKINLTSINNAATSQLHEATIIVGWAQ